MSKRMYFHFCGYTSTIYSMFRYLFCFLNFLLACHIRIFGKQSRCPSSGQLLRGDHKQPGTEPSQSTGEVVTGKSTAGGAAAAGKAFWCCGSSMIFDVFSRVSCVFSIVFQVFFTMEKSSLVGACIYFFFFGGGATRHKS